MNITKLEAPSSSAYSDQGTSYFMEGPNEGQRMELKSDAGVAEQQLLWAGLRSGMDAVDVGCASGAVTRVMSRIAAPGRVAGIDVSALRLEQAKQLAAQQSLSIDFMQGNIANLNLPSAQYDFAWSRFLFEYLPEPETALRELIRITRPNGSTKLSTIRTGCPLQLLRVDNLSLKCGAQMANYCHPELTG